MEILKKTLLTVTFIIASLLFLFIGADEDDVALRHSGRPTTQEEWRDEHQYEGRNAGGWRHANWNGGVDTSPEPGGGDWNTQTPNPYFYNPNPYENVYYDEYSPRGEDND
ncbi:MAG: hypothetical protein WCF65_03505 [Parachlamydiaceae bacterium]